MGPIGMQLRSTVFVTSTSWISWERQPLQFYQANTKSEKSILHWGKRYWYISIIELHSENGHLLKQIYNCFHASFSSHHIFYCLKRQSSSHHNFFLLLEETVAKCLEQLLGCFFPYILSIKFSKPLKNGANCSLHAYWQQYADTKAIEWTTQMWK